MKTESYRLEDETIAQIVQLVQMGILTGTDISDQIRTLRVILTDQGTLLPDPDFIKAFNSNLENLKEMAADESTEGQAN